MHLSPFPARGSPLAGRGRSDRVSGTPSPLQPAPQRASCVDRSGPSIASCAQRPRRVTLLREFSGIALKRGRSSPDSEAETAGNTLSPHLRPNSQLLLDPCWYALPSLHIHPADRLRPALPGRMAGGAAGNPWRASQGPPARHGRATPACPCTSARTARRLQSRGAGREETSGPLQATLPSPWRLVGWAPHRQLRTYDRAHPLHL